VGPLILIDYWLEDGWSMPAWAANVLGMAIGAVTICWFVYESVSPEGDDPIKRIKMPWPTSLVPLLGPLLLVLLPAKLLRPKSIGDHWGLQIIGLACIGLACTTVTVDDPGVFAVLLLAYLLSALWCLALFFQFPQRP